MPLGDSIKHGSANGDGGWRTELFRQAVINSKKITFVGQPSAGPGSVTGGTMTAPFPRNHEGLVLATVTPTKTDALNVLVKAYNDAMPALVASRVAMGKRIILVDMNGAFLANPSYKTAFMVDDLHPNPAGYVMMGKVWYEAIKSYLP